MSAPIGAVAFSSGLTRSARPRQGPLRNPCPRGRCGPRHVAPLLVALALLAAADRARRRRFPVRSTRGPCGYHTKGPFNMSSNHVRRNASRGEAPEITRADVEAVAADVRKPVLEVLTLLQAAAAHLNDGETTLDQLCAIKAEIL